MNPNYYKVQKERGISRKLQLIEYKGGKCEICGYDKNISALEFHHINPEEKDFQLDTRHLSNTNIETIKKEVDKCMLLCSNCHKETHYPEYDRNIILNTINEHKHVNVLDQKRKKCYCETCGKEFDYIKGKRFCSKKCRDVFFKRNMYPSKEEVINKYNEIKNWEKVALYYGLTRRIIQNIRKT